MSQLTASAAFAAVKATHSLAVAARVSGIVGLMNDGRLTEAQAQHRINRVYADEAVRVDPYHARLPLPDDRLSTPRAATGPDLGDVLA